MTRRSSFQKKKSWLDKDAHLFQPAKKTLELPRHKTHGNSFLKNNQECGTITLSAMDQLFSWQIRDVAVSTYCLTGNLLGSHGGWMHKGKRKFNNLLIFSYCNMYELSPFGLAWHLLETNGFVYVKSDAISSEVNILRLPASRPTVPSKTNLFFSCSCNTRSSTVPSAIKRTARMQRCWPRRWVRSMACISAAVQLMKQKNDMV